MGLILPLRLDPGYFWRQMAGLECSGKGPMGLLDVYGFRDQGLRVCMLSWDFGTRRWGYVLGGPPTL